VANLVEALRYRPEGHGSGSRIPMASLGFFFIDLILPAAL